MNDNEVADVESSGGSAAVATTKPTRRAVTSQKIPDDILNNALLQHAVNHILPRNYNFEIFKSVWRIRTLEAKRVALQMPDGLIMFAASIADLLEEVTGAECIILGDATYGACCIEDYTAKQLECDLIIHYGHSCLVPVYDMVIRNILYVFVDIAIDVKHLIDTIRANFPSNDRNLVMFSTVQFIPSLHTAFKSLQSSYPRIKLLHSKPLSPGEVLGCTAGHVPEQSTLLYVGDGRFHLEAALIANPRCLAYQYDPYTKQLTQEYYDHQTMRSDRYVAIKAASEAKTFGIIQGTLGRQGSLKVVERLERLLIESGRDVIIILISEIFPAKLSLFEGIDAFVQVACPRLSIDWALNRVQWLNDENEAYPIDFYAADSRGDWTPNHRPAMSSDSMETAEELRSELKHQLQVNADLKTLLVASVGSEFNAELNKLVSERCSLSNQIGQYDDILTSQTDKVDDLESQADLWHSKYMALKLHTDELRQRVDASEREMRRLDDARKQLCIDFDSIWVNLTKVYSRVLPMVKSNVQPVRQATLARLSEVINQLSKKLNTSRDKSIVLRQLSHSEVVLYNPPPRLRLTTDKHRPNRSDGPNNCVIERFHLNSSTIKPNAFVCHRCKGDVIVI